MQDSRGRGGAAGTPWQVHGRVGGRRGPQGVGFAWTQTGPPSLLSLTVSMSASPRGQGASVAPAPRTPAPAQPRPQPRPGLGVCELQVRARLQTCRGGGVIALAPSFSTVYNLLLCLHILSVHIIHQSKKRNYENLDQLSYDHKRGPKVYMHGRARHPRLGSPGRAPRPPGLPWAQPRHAAAEQRGRRARSRAGSLGRRGRRRPPGPRPQAARRRSGSLGSACESSGPRVSSRNPGGSPPARLQSSPGRSRRAGGQAPEDLPRFWKRRPSPPFRIAFQNSFLFPARCTPLSESRSTSTCMLSAKVRPGMRGGERGVQRASRRRTQEGRRSGAGSWQRRQQAGRGGPRARPRGS